MNLRLLAQLAVLRRLRVIVLTLGVLGLLNSRGFSGPFLNGSFELPGLPSGTSLRLPVGSTNVQGWTVIGAGGPVEWYNSTRAKEGLHDLHFNDSGASGTAIAQAFDTLVGAYYKVTFYVGRTGGGAGDVSLTASVRSQTGALLGQTRADAASNGYGTVQQLLFTATTSTTTLEFLDTSSGDIGAVDVLLDNVAVTILSWDAELLNGLRSWYRLDGDATDSSGSALNGTIYGAPVFVTGAAGQGVKLNGTNDWIDIGPDAALTNLTLAAWVRADGVAWDGGAWDLPVFFDNGPDELYLGIRGNGKFHGGHSGSGSIYSTTLVETGRLYHVAFTSGADGMARLYVNGIEEASATVGARNLGNPHDARLGNDRPGLQYFRGVIDDARIYDRALSVDELLHLSKLLTISGTVGWTGAVEGVVRVYAGDGRAGETTFGTVLAAPGAFGVSNVFGGAGYWVWAYMDRDGDGVHEIGDPTGVWSGSPAVLTNDLAGVAIALGESDVDADGMPDWWEIKYGLNPWSGTPGVGASGGNASFLGYGRGETLTNFPALLVLGTNILGFSYTNFASPQGWDLRITETNSTQELPYEIEDWNTNGNSYVWVKLPRLTRNGSPLSLSWGSNLTQAAYTTNGSVWADGFVSVHHMGGTNAVSTPDSRGSYSGTMNNMEAGDREVGVAGRALSFDGVDEYVSLPDGYSDFSSGMTISFWARPVTNIAQQRFVEFGVGAQDRTISLLANANSEFAYEIYEDSGTNPNLTAGSMTTGQWQQFVVTHDSGNQVRIFKDGFVVGTRSCALPSTVTRVMNQFARRGAGASPYYQGALDEVRVESVARSANWVWAAWMNQASNSSFVGWAVDQGEVGLDTDGDGLSDREEYQRDLNPVSADTDGDGMPDGWEVANGMDPKVADAELDPDGDGLTNGFEYWLGTRPMGSGAADSDGDGIGDRAEWETYGTKPTVADTDGDGLRDDWEVANSTNPLVADANEDRDLDGLSNAEEQTRGTWANRVDSDGDGKSDYENAYGKSPVAYHYDRNDRLTGAEHNRGSNGFSIAYFYDGNGNIVRQVHTGRDEDGDGISDWEEVRNGLSTTNSDAYADSDGDGWSNWQEVKAGSDAGNSNSTPDALGPAGTVLASWSPGFTPSNFVMASGQLDGLGAEEIVVGADGQPGALTNSLLILSQNTTGWTTQQVAVGPVGITSLAIGQPTNRTQAAIYAGTRDPGGAAGFDEIVWSNGTWQVYPVPTGSSGQVGRVLGVRPARDLTVECPLVGTPGLGLKSLSITGGLWSAVALSPSTNSRGPGYAAALIGTNQANVTLRPVDPEGIEAFSDGWSPPASVLSWPFDDGTATDASGRGVHGTAFGVTASAGRFIQGMSFDGSVGDYIARSNFVHPDTAFTIALWLRNTITTSGGRFFYSYAVTGQDNEVMLGIDGGNLRMGMKGQPIFAPCALADGQWHHLAVTWTSSGGQMKVWKDGSIAFVTNVFSGTTIIGGGSLVVGQDQDSVGGGFSAAEAYIGDIDEIRVDSRVLNDDEILSLARLAVRKIEEPSAVSRRLWQSQVFCSGNVRTNTGASGFYAFVDDKNASGSADAGDDFVVSEFKLDGSTNAVLGERHVSVRDGSSRIAYGLACADLLGSGEEVFFTGEAGGSVYSWTATNSTGPLERMLFSSQQRGKQWHQLGALGGLSGGDGLVGLLVDPVGPSSCNVVLWGPMGSLPRIAEPLQTAPVARCESVTNVLGSLPELAIRFWDGEGNGSWLELQYSIDGGATWHAATISMIDGNAALIGQALGALPGGTTHAVAWDARADVGSGYQGTVLLRSQARDAGGAGAWSVPVPYAVTVDVADLDLSMGDGPDPVVQGQELTYSLTLQNKGPTEAPGAAVDVTLPGGVTFVSAVSSQGSCTPSGGSVQCDLGLLGNGATATITIKVRPNAVGEIEASVVASHAGSDPVSGNNTANATTTVNGSDQLAVAPWMLDFGGVAFGGWLEAAFTLSNKGPSSVSGTAAVSAGVFEIVSGSPYDLAGYAAGQVVVRFTPSGNGAFGEDVIFESSGGTRTNRVVGVGADLPAPDFTATPTNGAAPLAVLFTDLTSASVTNRLWHFGDGGTASTTESNIAYMYELPGTNTVTLTVQGSGGASSVTKSNLIVVVMYPPGDVNGDGRVTGADSLLINQALVPPGLRQTNDAVFAKAGFRNGDVNGDGQVTGADSLRINQVLVQLRSFVVTKAMPSWRSNSVPTAVAVYGIGFPTQTVNGVTIGPPVSLSLSNVTAVSREEIRGVVPAGGGTGTGAVSVIAFPSNSVISTGTFENR